MKKDLRHHSFSLFNQLKGTNKFPNTTLLSAKIHQNPADKEFLHRNISTIEAIEIGTTGIALSVIQFLEKMGNTGSLLSQSKRSKFYQVTLFDNLPHKVTATCVHVYGKGIDAIISVSLLGETSKIHSRLLNIPLLPISKNVRYYVEIRSLEEFINWYRETFSEIKTGHKPIRNYSMNSDKIPGTDFDLGNDPNLLSLNNDSSTLNQ